MNRVAVLPLTDEQRATLERWLRAGTTPQRLVFRSRIVLLAARGMPSPHVARQLDTSQDTVRLWRRRFAAAGPDALRRDAPGRGRKRQITAAREQQVVEATLHRAPPRATQWRLRSMAAAQGLSPASIHRIWVAHGLQPHRARTFKRRCCMNTLWGWGGVARTSRDTPQEPHYRDEVEGPSHV